MLTAHRYGQNVVSSSISGQLPVKASTMYCSVSTSSLTTSISRGMAVPETSRQVVEEAIDEGDREMSDAVDELVSKTELEPFETNEVGSVADKVSSTIENVISGVDETMLVVLGSITAARMVLSAAEGADPEATTISVTMTTVVSVETNG
ncbi:MAG: hypothetical protein M1835_003805 [Candelina submexicana]|nr:MAG: hypothetical protein M1835_003805 [Candelina submexicana]